MLKTTAIEGEVPYIHTYVRAYIQDTRLEAIQARHPFGLPRVPGSCIHVFIYIFLSLYTYYVYIYIYVYMHAYIHIHIYDCFHKLGVFLVGVLKLRALLAGVCIRAPDFGPPPPPIGHNSYQNRLEICGTVAV